MKSNDVVRYEVKETKNYYQFTANNPSSTYHQLLQITQKHF